MSSTPGDGTDPVERAVGRYLRRVGLRYLPAAVVLLAVVLVVALVAPVRPSGTGAGPPPAANAGAAAGATTAAASGTVPSTPTGAVGAAGATSAPSAPSALSPPPGQAVSSPPHSVGPARRSATRPSSSAVATGSVSRTGVRCTPGARQFAWSRYSPPCVPAYRGTNGGATSPGVTGTTVTLTYRLANSTQQSALQALAGAAYPSDAALVADMQTYINLFNTQFELYGRHVVLRTFNAQGDFIEEDQGQDLAAAQSDAITAHDLGAFGDVTFLLESSQPYEQDLAQEHVLSFSSVGEPHSWYQAYAPYEWSVEGPEGSVAIDEAAAVVCRRLAGMPAEFSGDATYRLRNRTFGVLYPENPEYTQESQQFQADVAGMCGLHMAKVIAYSIDATQYEQEATAAVLQLKAAGVTSVFCACDPVFPILLSQSAQEQDYQPEFLTASFGDPVTRDYNQTVWSHAIAGGTQFPPLASTEAYRAYQLAAPGLHPAEWEPTSPPYFYVPYYQLLQVFLGLQAAGPDLTPATFARGMAGLPPSQSGDTVGGQWVYGPGVYDPVTTFNLVWWDPNAVSAFDGRKGAYRFCNGGQTYSYSDLAALGGPRQQLSCFGG